MASFILDNVLPINRDNEPFMFIRSISVHNLASMNKNKVIEYNPDIQRGTRTTKSGKVKEVFSLKHAKDILKAMLDRDIFGDVIILRYDKNNETPLIFNPETKELTIENDNEYFENPLFQIIDGKHRIESCTIWDGNWEKEPDSYDNPNNFEYPVIFLNMTDEEAMKVFSEGYKALPISKVRTKLLDVGNSINKIARNVMINSQLKGKIETVTSSVKKGSIITFGQLFDTIKNNFSPKTSGEAEKITSFLIEFFNELIEIFPRQLGEIDVHIRNEERKKSFILEPISYNGILKVASTLYGDSDWKNKIIRFNDIVKVGEWKGKFLDKENPIFSKVFREENKLINNSATLAYITNILYNYVINEQLEEKQSIAS